MTLPTQIDSFLSPVEVEFTWCLCRPYTLFHVNICHCSLTFLDFYFETLQWHGCRRNTTTSPQVKWYAQGSSGSNLHCQEQVFTWVSRGYVSSEIEIMCWVFLRITQFFFVKGPVILWKADFFINWLSDWLARMQFLTLVTRCWLAALSHQWYAYWGQDETLIEL